MDRLTSEERARIEEGIRQKYAKVATGPEGKFRYPTGREGLEGLGYDPELIGKLPETVLSSYCGVGNPFALGPVSRGEIVLDVGCGGGVDTMIAGLLVGPEGRATGVDPVPEMVERARRNLVQTGLTNVTFEKASGELIPFENLSFDLVISNGAFNLIPDKPRALAELFRVLKPGGRLMMADQVLTTEPPTDRESMVATWAGWQGGAIPAKDFLDMLVNAGFSQVELVTETGFNSSPVTKGVLLRALKAAVLM